MKYLIHKIKQKIKNHQKNVASKVVNFNLLTQTGKLDEKKIKQLSNSII